MINVGISVQARLWRIFWAPDCGCASTLLLVEETPSEKPWTGIVRSECGLEYLKNILESYLCFIYNNYATKRVRLFMFIQKCSFARKALDPSKSTTESRLSTFFCSNEDPGTFWIDLI